EAELHPAGRPGERHSFTLGFRQVTRPARVRGPASRLVAGTDREEWHPYGSSMTGEAAFGATVGGYTGTIPRLLDRAARRDPDGLWLRSDDARMSFAQAAGEVGVLAQALADEGIGHGDLILMTARTTPAYLLAWLALASLGAVTVPVNPASSEAEFAGLIRQV